VLTRVHKGRALAITAASAPWLHHAIVFQQLEFDASRRGKTGKLTIRPYSVVHSVIYDSANKRASGVRVIDAQTKETLNTKGALFSVRFCDRVHSVDAEFRTSNFRTAWQQQRRTRPQLDGSSHGQRRFRRNARSRRQTALRQPSEWNLRSPLSQHERQNKAKGFTVAMDTRAAQQRWLGPWLVHERFGVEFKNMLKIPGRAHDAGRIRECLRITRTTSR